MKRFLSLILILVNLICFLGISSFAYETESTTIAASSVSGESGIGFYDADGAGTLDIQNNGVRLKADEWVCYSLENIPDGVYNIYLTASNTEKVFLEFFTESGIKGTGEVKKSQQSASFSKRTVCENMLINELDKSLKIKNSGSYGITFKNIILERVIPEEFKIEAENVIEGGEGVGFIDGQNTSGGSLELSIGSVRTTVCARTDDAMMYDVSHLEKGSYVLSIFRSNTSSVNISVFADDEIYAVKSELPKAGDAYSDFKEGFLCIVNIDENTKTLKIENSGKKATYIDYINLGKINDSLSCYSDNKILGKSTFSEVEGEGYHDEKNVAFADFCTGNSAILHAGDWAAYDVLNFPEGIYEVSVYMSCKNDTNVSVLSGNNNISKNVSATGNYATYKNVLLGKIYLDSFEKLIIKSNKSAMYLGFLKLKKVSNSASEMYKQTISPDDVLVGGSGIGFYDTDTENGPKIEYNGASVVLRTSEWLCYDLSNLTKGRYKVTITASNTATAYVDISKNNEIIFKEKEIKATESFNSYNDFYLGEIDLTKDSETIKIENVKKASLIIKKITLELISLDIDLKIVKNPEGDSIDRLVGNDKLYIKGTIKNNYYLSNGVRILTAFYSANSTLCSIKSDVIDVKIGENTDVLIPVEDFDDASLVKAFIWQNEKSAFPLYQELSVYKGIDKHFYVDAKEGSDSFSGENEASPLKTIDAVKEKVKNISSNETGDVYIHLSGDFEIDKTLEFTEKDSGKNGFNIIYDGGGKTTFSGGKEISGFTKVEGTPLYKVKVENPDFRQLYINGNRAKRARSKWFYRVKGEYKNPDSDYINPDGYILKGEDFKEDFKKPYHMEMVWMPSWRNVRMPIENIERLENGDLQVTFLQPYFDSVFTSSAAVSASIPYYLENAPEFLDEPGEWYVNKDTCELFYYPDEADDAENLKAYIPYTEKLITLSGKEGKKIKGITFKGIDFKYGAWNRVTEKGISTVQAEQMYVPEKGKSDSGEYQTEIIPAQIEVSFGDNINLIGNKFNHLSSVALAFDNKTKNCSAIGNVFDDLSASAVTIGNPKVPEDMKKENMCSDILIENNLIRRASVEYMTPAVTAYYVNSVKISQNDIKDCPYTGISLGWGWNPNLKNCENNIVSGNRIENVLYKLRDGAHIYTMSKSGNSVIENNYLIKSGEWKGGIYLDNGSCDYTIRNNVVESCEKWLKLTWHNITSNTAYNNYSEAGIGTLPEYLNVNNLEEATKKTNGEWDDNAKDIILNAGLEDEYKHILDEYNKNTHFKNDELQSLLYIEKPGVSVGAGDLIEGGEGVAYHDILKDKYGCIGIVELSDGTGHKYMGNTEQGEWTKHEVVLKDDGTYKLSMRASAEKKNAKASVFIDDKPVYYGNIESTESYSIFRDYELGSIKLSKGKHIIKLCHEFSNFMPYSFTLTKEGDEVFERNDGFVRDIVNAIVNR